MQCRAIFQAVADVKMKGETVLPEVMIPLVAVKTEFDRLKKMVDRVAARSMEKTGAKFEYLVGTMIELPRAALIADKIAEGAQFFSFGTNDLTQTTFGLSRDDAGSFLGALPGAGRHSQRSVRQPRPGRRRRADPDRRASAAARPGRTSSSASAASTAAIRPRCTSATRSA